LALCLYFFFNLFLSFYVSISSWVRWQENNLKWNSNGLTWQYVKFWFEVWFKKKIETTNQNKIFGSGLFKAIRLVAGREKIEQRTGFFIFLLHECMPWEDTGDSCTVRPMTCLICPLSHPIIPPDQTTSLS
jgi:hypothetical protein